MARPSETSSKAVRLLEDRIEHIETLLERLDQQSKGSLPESKSDSAVGFCGLPMTPDRTFDPHVSFQREQLIRYIDKKWVNGTTLRYYFFQEGAFGGNKANIELVREAFEVWENVGIGISFEEEEDIGEAEIRIGFKRGDGAWSYVGRDVIDIPGQHERTMNFGWDLRHDPRGIDTPVHEIGHTLGFPHEHQNPFAGIVWDEEAVYKFFEGPPNFWSRDRTFHNVLRKLSTRDVEGSDWDPDSVMHYGFPANLILEPKKYQDGLTPAPGLSATDRSEVQKFYPKSEAHKTTKLEAFRSHVLDAEPADQRNFLLKPPESRTYQISAFGEADLLMVLFRIDKNTSRYVAGSDDSGTEDNASLQVRLEAGQEYLLRVRMFASYGTESAAIMYW